MAHNLRWARRGDGPVFDCTRSMYHSLFVNSVHAVIITINLVVFRSGRYAIRFKPILAPSILLVQSSCTTRTLVHQAGKSVITYPDSRGHHADFNLGLNYAESIKFLLERWPDVERRCVVVLGIGELSPPTAAFDG